MPTECGCGRHERMPCQDCAGIGRVWIEGVIQDCPECGGSGWESAVGVPSPWGFEAVFPTPGVDWMAREGRP